MASVVAFIEGRLSLEGNRAKCAVAHVEERSFPCVRLLCGGGLFLAPKSLARAQERLRRLTRRNRGIALERMIGEVGSFTTGRVTCFRNAAVKGPLMGLDDGLRQYARWCQRGKP